MKDPFLTSILEEFVKHKQYADGAVAQLEPSDLLFAKPASDSNSIAAIMKHVCGNLESRWRDFLTTDGEKPDRNRDLEFVIAKDDTVERILQRWESGWGRVFTTLGELDAGDLGKTITIRNQPLSVPTALCRSLAHTAYHVGQIVYLARMLFVGDWRWMTIPPGGSAAFNAAMSAKQDAKPV